jgi:hypothetical protein
LGHTEQRPAYLQNVYHKNEIALMIDNSVKTKCLVTGAAPHAAANLDFTYFHSIETTAASTADFWDVQSAACKTTTPTPAVKSAGSLLTVASTTTATTLLIAATLSIVALC